MTNTALHQANLAQEAKQLAVSLRELGLASRRFTISLWKWLTKPSQACLAKTARKDAERLRAVADKLYRADPHYVQDIYAAAPRHELAASYVQDLYAAADDMLECTASAR